MNNKRKRMDSVEEVTRSSTTERAPSTAAISPIQTPNRPVTNATPPSSTKRQSLHQQQYSDRFIPSRSMTKLDDAFDILENKMNYRDNLQDQNIHESQVMMNNLLRSELLGQSAAIDQYQQLEGTTSSRSSDAYFKSPSRKDSSSIGSANNLFKYRPSSASLTSKTSLDSQLSSNTEYDNLSNTSSPARRTLSIGGSSNSVSGPKPLRKIPKAPYKVLDAPSLQDDYYLNLLDWSANNVLAVALSNSVYLWSAFTSKVLKLCEYEADSETVTSIAWSISHPQHISVGTSLGRIQIWDSVSGKMLRELRKHDSRVGALAWNSVLLASGSRDRSICVQDVRMYVHGSSSSYHSHANSHVNSSASSITYNSSHNSSSGNMRRVSLGGEISPGIGMGNISASTATAPNRRWSGTVTNNASNSTTSSDINSDNNQSPPITTNPSMLSPEQLTTPPRSTTNTTNNNSNINDAMPPPVSFPTGFPLFAPATSTSTATAAATESTSIISQETATMLAMITDQQSLITNDTAINTTNNVYDQRNRMRQGVFSPARIPFSLPPPPSSSSSIHNHNNSHLPSPTIFASPGRNHSHNNSHNNLPSNNSVFNSSGIGSTSHNNGGVVCELRAHRQEVCGLKWSFDEKMLASGGNDNKLYVWDPQQGASDPLHRFEDHVAAVKAVAWSPHQAGLLASGGGTADRHIRFWNAATGVPLHKIDTGSQVCNLMWSRTVNEVVSTHGYSLNQIIVWKYPSMQKLATLSGHSMRVLYLAMSPDGQSIVTGAGDETLRFWNVFPVPKNRAGLTLGHSALVPSTADVR